MSFATFGIDNKSVSVSVSVLRKFQYLIMATTSQKQICIDLFRFVRVTRSTALLNSILNLKFETQLRQNGNAWINNNVKHNSFEAPRNEIANQ